MKTKDKNKKKQSRIIRIFIVEYGSQRLYTESRKDVLEAVKHHMKFIGRYVTVSSIEITRKAWLTQYTEFNGWKD